jgi:hypothetical protein
MQVSALPLRSLRKATTRVVAIAGLLGGVLAIQSDANASGVGMQAAPLANSWKHDGPVNIIFDTDMGNDIDDVLALAMIHALEDRGAVKLLAVTITKDHELAVPFVDALNSFYCRPDLPIGMVQGGLDPRPGKYLKLMQERNRKGNPVFRHDLRNSRAAPDAVPMLRKLLAESEDNSVVLVQTGFFTNFHRLLETGPDKISPLSGRELISRKVSFLSAMAGAFQSVDDSNVFPEWNVKRDIGPAKKIAQDWPTPIIWAGYEAGVAVSFPWQTMAADFKKWDRHIVRDAFYLHRPPATDTPTWDLISVVAAVYGDRGYYDLSLPGNVTVEDNGFTSFRPVKDGKHKFVKISPEQAVRLKEFMVNMVGQPPMGENCK